jgi:hypothetical protein
LQAEREVACYGGAMSLWRLHYLRAGQTRSITFAAMGETAARKFAALWRSAAKVGDGWLEHLGSSRYPAKPWSRLGENNPQLGNSPPRPGSNTNAGTLAALLADNTKETGNG